MIYASLNRQKIKKTLFLGLKSKFHTHFYIYIGMIEGIEHVNSKKKRFFLTKKVRNGH